MTSVPTPLIRKTIPYRTIYAVIRIALAVGIIWIANKAVYMPLALYNSDMHPSQVANIMDLNQVYTYLGYLSIYVPMMLVVLIALPRIEIFATSATAFIAFRWVLVLICVALGYLELKNGHQGNYVMYTRLYAIIWYTGRSFTILVVALAIDRIFRFRKLGTEGCSNQAL